jgi:hypothetical protein
LSLAHGAEQVDDAVGIVGLAARLSRGFEPELLVGMYRPQAAELGTLPQDLRRLSLDRGNRLQRGTFPLGCRTHRACDLVTGSESELADEPLADVNVALGGQIARFAPAEKAAPPACDLENAEHQVVAVATERLMR